MPFPLASEFVALTESKLRVRLPLGYVARMCKSNGGTVQAAGDMWQLYPIFDDSDKKRIKRTCNDIVRETKNALQWAGFPPSGVAIGFNGGGDLLIFSRIDDENRLGDVVHWWDHETGEVHVVALDFSELPKSD